MLYEALIHIPLTDNNGNDTRYVVEGARKALIDAFGGVTESEVTGYWRNDAGETIEDYCATLTVAYNPDLSGAEHRLLAIAEHVGYSARQDCVYLRYASGQVEIVPTKHLWALNPAKAIQSLFAADRHNRGWPHGGLQK